MIKQLVVILVGLASPAEARLGEIVVEFSVIIEHRFGKNGQIASGTDLTAVGQAGRIDEPSVLETEALGLDGHELGKSGFRASEALGDNDGDVIG